MAECLHYTECIRKNKEPIARPDECVLIMEIINALYKSAEKNAEVKIKA